MALRGVLLGSFLLLACGRASRGPLGLDGTAEDKNAAADRNDGTTKVASIVDAADAPTADATDGDGDDGLPRCCPYESTPSGGCANLGGAPFPNFGCVRTCDFWCSTNWRVEVDEQGCEVVRMDHREPAPGEDFLCLPGRDGGPGADGRQGQ